MNALRAVVVSAIALLVIGCGQASGPDPDTQQSEAPSAQRPSTPASASPSGESGLLRLPTAGGPPRALEAGTYLTPEGFEPAISVTVPEGWYGGAGRTGFGVGQGLNEAAQRFADAGLNVDVIALPYEDAVAVFGQLPDVVFREPTSSTKIGGREATVFSGDPRGGNVLLDELVPGIDLPAGSHQQIFVDLGHQTVLIRTELFDDDAESTLADVVNSLEFP